MKLSIDTDSKTVVSEGPDGPRQMPLYSPEAFSAISQLWLKVGWDLKYAYGFSWMGRPIIQLPEDILRIQEAIYRVRPDVLVETGVAHGGSLVFYASLFKAMGQGRVIGVDIEIRPHNRVAVETHEVADLISLVEGSSTDPSVVARVQKLLRPDERVLVILDSNHSKAHVAAELEAYAPFVAAGSYIVATDGIMKDLHDVPRGRAEWRHDNPTAAATEFAARHPEFLLQAPAPGFDESLTNEQLTYWPSAYLLRCS